MSSQPFEQWLVHWKLTPDGSAFATRHGSRLLPVLWQGEQAILKIAAHQEERRGGALMAWYGGMGAARVLAREDDALLLERLTGQRSLSDMAKCGRDDCATRILCRTAMALHAPRDSTMPAELVPLAVWFRALEHAGSGQGGTLAACARVARDLLADQRELVVLHGDLHHDNVLDGGARGWLAIDPKGLMGERGFDYANLFCNPDHDTAVAPGRLARRADLVAQVAGLERKRLLQWIVAWAGLSAAFLIEDGAEEYVTAPLKIAEIAAAELNET